MIYNSIGFVQIAMITTTTFNYAKADGVDIFYREAGSKGAPTVLLLHGFPSSSFQYRNLITILAARYHVVAPDLPGYGFTKVSEDRKYAYKFDSFANTISDFVDVLAIKKFAVYIFDYGAPTALRLALKRPELISAIVSQNGNAYVEGFGETFWAPLKKLWKDHGADDRKALRDGALNLATTQWQYENGTPSDRIVAPETYTLDYALFSGREEIQLDLFEDYGTNLDFYPKFQEYFRKSQVPLLAVWGKNDDIFVAAGAVAFKEDLPKAEIHLLDAGHFAVETHTSEIADLMLEFFKKIGY